jgi:hypothetical protein
MTEDFITTTVRTSDPINAVYVSDPLFLSIVAPSKIIFEPIFGFL